MALHIISFSWLGREPRSSFPVEGTPSSKDHGRSKLKTVNGEIINTRSVLQLWTHRMSNDRAYTRN